MTKLYLRKVWKSDNKRNKKIGFDKLFKSFEKNERGKFL